MQTRPNPILIPQRLKDLAGYSLLNITPPIVRQSPTGFGRSGAEIILDLGFQGQLIAFQGEQEIGLVRDDLVGDLDLAAHGVDGHQGAFELPCFGEVVEKLRDGGDLVGLFRDAELRQRQPGVGRVGAERVQGLQALGFVVRAARRSCRRSRSGRAGRATAP